MANQSEKTEKRKWFRLDAITVGGVIFTLVALILFTGAKALESHGYMLRPTSVKYWFRLALIMGIVFLIAKFITNVPKRESSVRTAKICSVVLCVTTAFLMYWQTVGYIDLDFHEKMELATPDGKQKYAVMEMDYKSKSETASPDEQVHFRFFRIYPKRNSLFYDCSRYYGEESMPTMLVTDPETSVKYQWEGDTLRLYQEGGAPAQELDEQWQPLVDSFSDELEYAPDAD